MKLTLAGLLLAGAAVAWYFALRPSGPPPRREVEAAAAPAEEIHYICQDTGQLSQGPRVETPALNPKTGRKRLVQALYCEACQKWLAKPEAPNIPGQSLGPRCPKHGTPLAE